MDPFYGLTMAADWLDPLGLRGIADKVATSAARVLIGRRVEVEAAEIVATVAAVHEAAPATGVSAALSAQLGLWRRLDIDFSEVAVRGVSLESARITARDVRVIDALPQRLGAKQVDLVVGASAEQTKQILDANNVGGSPAIVDGLLMARIPGFGKWGQVVLEPWVDGRRIGADATRARVRSKLVALPQRFQRRFERELEWLPPRTTLQSLTLTGSGRAELRATIGDYDIAVDVPRLLADLGARGTTKAIDVFLGDW